MSRRLHLVVAAFFGAAGLGHFLRADFFEAVVPPWFPHPALANKVSGAAEILLALGMVPRSTRRAAGWGLIGLLAVVFPANIDMALADVELVRGEDGRWTRVAGGVDDARNWIRLPVQLLLAALVLRAAELPGGPLTGGTATPSPGGVEDLAGATTEADS